MSVNPSIIQNDIEVRKTVVFDGKKSIEFAFNRINRATEYDDIIIQLFNPEYQRLYGEFNNPLFVRENTLYSYYKSNDAEYIKIMEAIGSLIAKVYNLNVRSEC